MVGRRSRTHAMDGGTSWVIAGAAFMSHFCTVGLAYTMGVYYVAFLEDFGESSGKTAWIGSLNNGMLCLIGPVASMIINRFGCGVTVFVGGLVSSVGILCSIFATDIYILLVTFGFIAGSGFGLCFAGSVIVISIYFNELRPLAMGLSMAGVGCGTFVYPVINQKLIQHFGWRGALLITSAINLHVCACGLLMGFFNPITTRKTSAQKETYINNNETKTINKRAEPNRTCLPCCKKPSETPVALLGSKEKQAMQDEQTSSRPLCGSCDISNFVDLSVLGQSNLWLLGSSVFLFCFGMMVLLSHVSAFATSAGLGSMSSAMLISGMGISNLIGRMFLGFILRKQLINIYLLYILCYCTAGLSAMAITVWKRFVPMLIFACIHGFNTASYGPVLSEVTCLLIGVEKFASAYGNLMMFMGAGVLLGPPAAGVFYDLTGNYPITFYCSGAIFILSCVPILPAYISALKAKKLSPFGGTIYTQETLVITIHNDHLLVENRITSV